MVNPGESEQEVGVPGGQVDRLQVIVLITLFILTVFFRIYIKMWFHPGELEQEMGVPGGHMLIISKRE